MDRPDELIKIEQIAFQITHGDLRTVDLVCPYCAGELIFSFSKIRDERIGLFIECRDCRRRHHFNLAAKPPNFIEDLILKKYQDIEDEVQSLIKGSA